MHNQNYNSSPWFDSVCVQGSPWTSQDLKQAPPTNTKITNQYLFKKKKKFSHFLKERKPSHQLLEQYYDHVLSLPMACILRQPVEKYKQRPK